MATVTTVLGRIFDGPAEARVEVDYDDTSDPENWDLVAVRCLNGLARPVTIRIRRGNGVSWFTIQVPAGQTRSMNAGGPVREMDDIPIWELAA